MYTSTVLLSALATLSIASPLTPGLSRRDGNAPMVTMTFTGGPASYTSTFVANGLYQGLPFPSDQLSVSQISSTGITDIANNCTFSNSQDGSPITGSEFCTNADGSLTMGPPGPITGVTCGTPGQCAPLYAQCMTTLPNGQEDFLSCCKGWCHAGGICHPF